MVDFPNVPDAPGVPAVLRDPIAIAETIVLLVADSFGLLGQFASQEWGLFLNGSPVVIAESVVSFEFKEGYRIATFPIEPDKSGQSPGTFESYNKVQKPFDVRLRFTTGGDRAARQELEASCRAAIASLDLMDAVTPEVTYQNLNPTGMDYRRTAINGVGLLSIDLFCEQVRTTATSTFTNAAGQSSSTGETGSTAGTTSATPSSATIVNPQSPSAAPQVNAGTVQPQAAPATEFSLSQALP